MEALDKQAFKEKFINPFEQTFFFQLNEKFPRIYFALQLFIAVIGIAFLLLFPYFVITLPTELYDSVISANGLKDWIDVAILFTLIVIGAIFSWAIYKLKFTVPTGVEVTEVKFPHLIKLITELRGEYGDPKISRIIIRDKYDIHVIKTPHSGMPFLNTCTLVIGLPVLLTMSPLYFRALLARRIGQLSTKHTPITTRLYFLNDIWQQFKDSCRHSKNIPSKILAYFFKIYTPLYQKSMMPLLQKEELEADSYGMDLVNSHDMVECIVYEEVVTHFLQAKFWPKIYHMAKRSKTPEYLPYSQMTKVIKMGITNDEISETIQAALKSELSKPSIKPSLPKRLNHLGHAKPLAPKRLKESAADYYLGKTQQQIIELFDKRWIKKLHAKRT